MRGIEEDLHPPAGKSEIREIGIEQRAWNGVANRKEDGRGGSNPPGFENIGMEHGA